MSAPTIDRLQYRDPHMPVRGQPYTSPYTLADLEAMRGNFHPLGDLARKRALLGHGHKLASPRRGWHGPLPAALHAEHEARERAEAERRHAAHIAQLAHDARRSANPMWAKVNSAIDDHGDSSLDAECATDAVMDAVYGEGRW